MKLWSVAPKLLLLWAGGKSHVQTHKTILNGFAKNDTTIARFQKKILSVFTWRPHAKASAGVFCQWKARIIIAFITTALLLPAFVVFLYMNPKFIYENHTIHAVGAQYMGYLENSGEVIPRTFEDIPTDKSLFVVLPEINSTIQPSRFTQKPTTVKLPTGPAPEDAIHFFITEPTPMGPKMREFCPIEAAAKLHPDKPVVVHIAADTLEVSSIVYELNQAYKNIAYLKMDIREAVKDTPLEDWYDPSIIESAMYRNSRMSDITRSTTLYKYGGWYLDSDLIVIRRISNFRNTLALVGFDYLTNNNFMAFDKRHLYLKEYLESVTKIS